MDIIRQLSGGVDEFLEQRLLDGRLGCWVVDAVPPSDGLAAVETVFTGQGGLLIA
jgi:hypothetical protein